MKEVKAVIRPVMADAVLDALHEVAGLPGITISDVRGVNTGSAGYTGVTMTKLEVMVADHLVDDVVRIIEKCAHTGQPGDGRIFVIPIEKTVKIRTGERGDHAA